MKLQKYKKLSNCTNSTPSIYLIAKIYSYYVCIMQKASLVGTGGPAPCRWALPDR